MCFNNYMKKKQQRKKNKNKGKLKFYKKKKKVPFLNIHITEPNKVRMAPVVKSLSPPTPWSCFRLNDSLFQFRV